MLGRTFNVNTQCYEAPGRSPLPAEMADGIHTMLDLLAVLIILEKRDALLVQDSKVATDGNRARAD